ncbi:MAG TPA: hypothetical protein VGJ94_02170 [Syntrophorhabdaceae bacterium]|jgi:hypothetical protein
MIRNILVSIIMGAFFVGCTTFTHPGKDPKEFAGDRKSCEQYVADNPGPNATCEKDSAVCATCEDVKRCLEQKGWKRVR